MQGAEQVKRTTLNPNYFFFYPPSFEALETRMRGRNSETEETIALRLKNAKAEIDWMDANRCHVKIVNDNLDEAYAYFKKELLTHYPHLTRK